MGHCEKLEGVANYYWDFQGMTSYLRKNVGFPSKNQQIYQYVFKFQHSHHQQTVGNYQELA